MKIFENQRPVSPVYKVFKQILRLNYILNDTLFNEKKIVRIK